MDPERRRRLITEYRDGLLTDTVPFWLRHGVDPQYGGIITSLNRDGSVVDTDKGVWQQGRFAWLMGELYNTVEPREEWLQAGLHTARFLLDHCIDSTDGRMWFHVTRDGQPLRKRRYAFSESFAAIAFGELAQATGREQFRDQAVETFHRFLSHHQNPTAASSKYTATRPFRSLGLPMITLMAAQELRDSVALQDADEWIERSITTIRDDFVRDDIECVMEIVSPDGGIIDHFDGRMLNPGHAIEAAWFILREARHRGDNALVQLGCRMLDWMWNRGWDPEYGGLLSFVDVFGLPVQEYWHDMKFWWPHNETVIALLLAWTLTGNTLWLDRHRLVNDWSRSRFHDPEYGEWFGYLHRDGRLSVPLKGNLWKGPFHLPRMQLVCWQLLQADAGPRIRL